MKIQLLLIVQLVLAAMLMWTCFCRSVKTDRDTHREVRWAILFEGIAAGLVFGAPLMPVLMPPVNGNWSPDWPAWTTPVGVWLVLLGAVTLVQIVTAKYWAQGQAPIQFQRSPRERTGGVVFAALLLVVGLASLPLAHAQGARQAEAVPIGEVPYGMAARCGAPEGCVMFTKTALVVELINFAGELCNAGDEQPAAPEKQRL